MANTTQPLPPFPGAQPGDMNVVLNDPNETAIRGFQYNTGPNPAPPSFVAVLRAGLHYEYAVSKRITYHSGLKCTPVQGPPGTPMSVTRETAPWGQMVVYWKSSRRNGNPVVPSQDLGDANTVFEKGCVDVPGPGFMADGTKAIVRMGVYYYWLRLPYAESDTILAAAYPDTDDELTANTLVAADFSKLVIGPNQPPAGAPTNKITF
jgi:hypothetical protein